MTKSKIKGKINWYYVVVGLILLIFCFYRKGSKIHESDLNTITITLSHDIQNIHGYSRSEPYHRLWTTETNAAFTIAVPGGITAGWTSLDSLKKGDTLTIKYPAYSEKELQDKSKEIPIYFLQKAGRLFFDTAGYNKAETTYDNRWNKLALIGGMLLVLHGLTIINSKTTYILGGILFAVIIVLRILNRF